MDDRETRTPLSHALQYAGLSLLSGGFSILPYRLAIHSGDALGRLVHRVARLRLKVAADNLDHAFPERSSAERSRILAGTYRQLGRTLAEFCRYPVLNAKVLKKRVTIEGEDHLAEAVAEGRGVVLLTAHLANWELLGAAIAGRGYPTTFLVGPHRNKLAEEMFNRYRGLNQVEVLVTKGGDLKGVFRALKAGRIVCTVADQDAGREGYFLDFLGRPASAALGPFRIARRTGSPIVLAFDTRRGMDHTVTIDPPLRSDPAIDPVRESEEWARRYHERLTGLIRANPEQWLWMHHRWRSRPRPEGAVARTSTAAPAKI